MTVRLLFDENLPPGLVADLADVYPDSVHVRDIGLQSASEMSSGHVRRRTPW